MYSEQRVRVVDDSGRSYKTGAYEQLSEDRDEANAQAVLAGMRAVTIVRRTKSGWKGPWFAVGLALLIVVSSIGPGVYVAIGVPALSYVVMSICYGGGAGRVVADELLAARVCPVCVYDLDGIEPSDDRLICPECGAEWNTSRLRTPVKIDTAPSRTLVDGSAVVRDAERKRVPLVGVYGDGRIRGSLSPGHQAKMFKAQNSIESSGAALRSASSLACIAVGLLTGITLLSLVISGPGRSGALIYLMGPAVMIWFGAYGLWQGRAFQSPRRTVREMLVNGLCPSCAAEIPCDGGGESFACVGCPAVWSAEQVRSTQSP